MSYAVVTYEAKETVFRQGDPGPVMFLVQAGELELVQELAGFERQVGVLKKGDFFGEQGIFDDHPREHSVRALVDSSLVRIGRSDLAKLLERKPAIAVRLMRSMSHRLRTDQDMLARAWLGNEASQADFEPEIAKTATAHLFSVHDRIGWELPNQERISIGRLDPLSGIEPDLDLTPLDPQYSTSRRHAMILRRDDRIFMIEEKATNGTFVNGRRISAQTPLEIRHGDEILFGGVRLQLQIEGHSDRERAQAADQG